MAPENWSCDENMYKTFYCQKNSDIFSMGMVFWELADGRGALPWGDADIFKIRDYIVNEKKRPPIPDATPQAFSDLFSICWRDNPQHRPCAADVFLKVQEMASQVCSSVEMRENFINKNLTERISKKGRLSVEGE